VFSKEDIKEPVYCNTSVTNNQSLKTVIMNPLQYLTNNKTQTDTLRELIDEFTEELMKMSGKCMDIGCGPGYATKEILLPVLHENAKVIGKKEVNSSRA
jgi:hypothetical protein